MRTAATDRECAMSPECVSRATKLASAALGPFDYQREIAFVPNQSDTFICAYLRRPELARRLS